MSDFEDKGFDTIEAAIEAIAAGRPIVVTDDENRENEGDLVVAASGITTENVNFMIRYARGLICVPMMDSWLKRLGIGDMVPQNRDSFGTAFTVSVDAAQGITTGISAFDRAVTIRLLANPEARPHELVQPGHLFPLRAKNGGVLERSGHTEAAIDLVSMAGFSPCAAICEILNDDGSMARLPELIEFKKKHGLKMISVAQLIEHRLAREQLVDRVESRPFASDFGTFTLHHYRARSDKRLHTVLTVGALDEEPTLVRVQVGDATSDVFRETGTDGYHCLTRSLERIAEAGKGALVYLDGVDPTAAPGMEPADRKVASDGEFRRFGIGALILRDLGLRRIRLLTNSRKRLVALRSYGIEIVEHIAP